MSEIGLGLSVLSLMIWLWLLCFRGQFWLADQRLEEATPGHSVATQPGDRSISTPLPSVCAVIPARNEADVLPRTVRSLLCQTYPGSFTIILVDDHSTDGTAEVAQAVAQEMGKANQLQILAAEPLPPGWTGKLWALEQGTQKANLLAPDFILLTDADIEHHPDNLTQLVTKAEQESLDLVSIMVRLRCESFWETVLIPAFVFFFQKLYPFPWVNNPNRSTAAAAGGCILIRRPVLEAIGGIQVVRQALIDDCSLAQAVKVGHINSSINASSSSPVSPAVNRSFRKIWLGLSDLTISLRPYPSLKTIWDMVARTAFTQLNYSPWLLIGTLIGMTIVYLVPPMGLLIGGLTGNWTIALLNLLTWGLMTLAYLPTVQFYRCSPVLATCLPAIALLYNLMTLDSAIRYWQGRGGAWKGRVYSN